MRGESRKGSPRALMGDCPLLPCIPVGYVYALGSVGQCLSRAQPAFAQVVPASTLGQGLKQRLTQ